ncbi:hypothetical protein TNCV_2676811 [Trichonephila clavipes]|nr:hypothetical protein TNCV_2676811 [Trichonephila clavipes]
MASHASTADTRPIWQYEPKQATGVLYAFNHGYTPWDDVNRTGTPLKRQGEGTSLSSCVVEQSRFSA